MIVVENLTFDYPGTRALDRVSFRVTAGSITALVGPNGAGKTTLLRALAALEEPVAGTIRIAGIDVLAEPRACHRQVGYLSDFFGLYDELTVRQCLLHAAAIRGLAAAAGAAAALRSATRLGLAERLEAKAGTLSRGLRQRLAIAQAIVHRPALLLLDEPASGLDPEARHSLARLFLTLRDEGMTLLVSSHILAELDEYSDDMLVLRAGKLVAHNPVRAPAQPAPATPLRLLLATPCAGLGALLAAADEVTQVCLAGLTATFNFSGDDGARHRLLRRLIEAGAEICALAEERPNLQQAYLDSVRGSAGEVGR